MHAARDWLGEISVMPTPDALRICSALTRRMWTW